MPTKIINHGFLSDEALQRSESIRREHKQLFFHLDDLNEKAHRHLRGFPAGLKQLKLVLTAALFMRALTAYQALIFLAERGFASEARATCRNIMDAKFRLAYFLNKPDADLFLIAKSEAGRAKRLKARQSGKLRLPQELVSPNLDPLILEAEGNQKDSTGKKLALPPTEKIAKDCGLEEDYLGCYSIFSEATHSGVVELETYLKLNAERTMVEQYLYGPQDGDWVGWVTLLGAEHLLDCMQVSAEVFGVRSRRDFKIFFDKLLERQGDLEQRHMALVQPASKVVAVPLRNRS